MARKPSSTKTTPKREHTKRRRESRAGIVRTETFYPYRSPQKISIIIASTESQTEKLKKHLNGIRTATKKGLRMH